MLLSWCLSTATPGEAGGMLRMGTRPTTTRERFTSGKRHTVRRVRRRRRRAKTETGERRTGKEKNTLRVRQGREKVEADERKRVKG